MDVHKITYVFEEIQKCIDEDNVELANNLDMYVVKQDLDFVYLLVKSFRDFGGDNYYNFAKMLTNKLMFNKLIDEAYEFYDENGKPNEKLFKQNRVIWAEKYKEEIEECGDILKSIMKEG